MKKEKISFGRSLRVDLEKVFTSVNLYFAIVLNLIVLGVSFYIKNMTTVEGIRQYGISHEFFYVFYFDVIPELVILISAFPVVGIFCNEWNAGYAKFEVSRMGVKKYLYNKVVVCIVVTLFTALISQLIMTVVMGTQMPMITEMGANNLKNLYPFGSLIDSPYLYQFIRIFCFSSFCCIWCCLGLLISAYIPNKYVVYTTSYVGYYLAEQLFNNKVEAGIPNCMSIMYLSTTSLSTPLFNNVLLDFVYINALFIVIALVLGCLFVRKAGRRMRYE